MLVLLDVDPFLAGLGQTAAIIICLFVFIFVLISVAFNLVMVLGTAWLREKANLIKMLRPSVDSVNKTSEAVIQGQPADESKNGIVSKIAQVPAGMHTADKKVDELTAKVTDSAIEFRARTIQVQTVVKAFLFPNASKQRGNKRGKEAELEYRALLGENSLTKATLPVKRNGDESGLEALQLRDVPVH